MRKNKFIGKRVAGIDFGLMRIGVAYSDSLHVSITTGKTFLYDELDFWEKFVDYLNTIGISAVVVGMPYRSDGKETMLIKKIKQFVIELQARTVCEVILYDESYSSKRAENLMIEIGKKKKQRRVKSTKDKIAAAIILRDFLNEIEG